MPTAIKKLRGNPGKRKLNEKEPAVVTAAPAMPDELKGNRLAQREWKAIVPELLKLGVLSNIDGKALAAYCCAWSRWWEAEKHVKKFGIIIREPVLLLGAPTGYFKHKKNPAVNVSEVAMKTMKSFLIEFGLTPSSRTRLRIEKPAEEDPFEQYLKGGAATPAASKTVN